MGLMDATFAVTSTIPGYQVAILLTYLVGGVGGLLFWVYRAAETDAGRKRARSWTVFWFVLCAFIHSVVEMAFVVFRTTSSFHNALDLYSAADYRYGRPRMEAGTAAMEFFTGIVTGPLCLVTAYGIVKDTRWRHTLQLITSVCQFYGLSWFILHPFFEAEQQVTHDPFLFVVVLVGMNAPWGIIPPILGYQSFMALSYGSPSGDRSHSKANGASNGAAPPQAYRADISRKRN